MAITPTGTWTPDPSVNLDQQSELASINESIYFDVPPWNPPDEMYPQPIWYDAWWTSVRIPPHVSLIPSSTQLVVVGPDVTGLAPITVSYMLNNVSHTVLTFDALPPPDKEQKLYNYIAPATNKAYATFMVRVTVEHPDTHEQATTQQEYTIEVTIDYTAGRNRLVQEVDLRR